MTDEFSRFNKYVGRTFNKLTILSILRDRDAIGRILCKCKCHCNDTSESECTIPIKSVISGSVKSCGCLRIEKLRNAIKCDMIGKTFGRLTVISEDPNRDKTGNIRYVCRCSCPEHTMLTISGPNLRNGYTKSCGCLQKEARHRHALDITGRKYGHLIALYPTDKRCGSSIVWRCRCEYCGNECEIPLNRLTNGQQSCGKCTFQTDLARLRNTKWKSPEEKLLIRKFNGMVTRCYNKNDQNYKDYGGRGIYICKEWTDDRGEFVKWGISAGFKPGMSIDRIDVNGPYAPWNCRFVNGVFQANNKRSNVFVKINDISVTLSQWAILINRKSCLLYQLNIESYDDVKAYIEHIWLNMSTSDKKLAIERLNSAFGKDVVKCTI